MNRKERYNLLKNACEKGLKQNPKILEGKELVYSENNGKPWKESFFYEFNNIPEKEVRICISPVTHYQYYIVISSGIDFAAVARSIKENIKEKNNNLIVTALLMYDNTIVITVMF